MKKLLEKLDEIRWNHFGMQEDIDKLKKNVYIEYRDRLLALEKWVKRILDDPDKYKVINSADTSNEKAKYISLYDGDLAKWHMENKGEVYGHENWGSGIIKYLKKVQPKSLLDVGCGAGKFCIQCKPFIKKVYGLDIASVITKKIIKNDSIKYIDGCIENIPLEDNNVEWVTGFDVLEHIPESNLEKAFYELDRVSTKGMIFSISHDRCEYNGEIMHKTIRPRDWWIEQLKEFGEVRNHGETPYMPMKYILCLKGIEND